MSGLLQDNTQVSDTSSLPGTSDVLVYFINALITIKFLMFSMSLVRSALSPEENEMLRREYLARLVPTDHPTNELWLERYFKKAIEKKKERWQRKCLQTSVTPAGLRAEFAFKEMKDHPFSISNSSAISSDTVDSLHYELPFANGFPEEPTLCTPSHRPLYLLQKLLHGSPIVDGILSISSASAIANLYCAVGLERPDWVNRYITPLRDIFSPLELEQVHKISREGYTFILLGEDLHKMEERLQDPEKYYSNPNRQAKLRAWMLMIQSTVTPPLPSGQNKNMPINFPPGEWLNQSLRRSYQYANDPTHAMKWNTDPDIHVEWYEHLWRPFKLRLPFEVLTSESWNWDNRDDVTSLDFIDVGRHPNVIRELPFKHLTDFPIRGRGYGYRLCGHGFLVQLGRLTEPEGMDETWVFNVPIFPRCEDPECRDGSICFQWDQGPCISPKG